MLRNVLATVILAGAAGPSAPTDELPEAGAAVPQPQATFLPDVTSTKVKTLRLDSKGHVLPGSSPSPATSAQPEKSAVVPILPPPIKVPVYRVDADGTMHAPSDPEQWPSTAGAPPFPANRMADEKPRAGVYPPLRD